MPTTDHLLKAGGVSKGSLDRWRLAGLIPEAKRLTHPSGRGRKGFYEDWVVERCHEIRRLLDEGHTLKAIKERLVGSASRTKRGERKSGKRGRNESAVDSNAFVEDPPGPVRTAAIPTASSSLSEPRQDTAPAGFVPGICDELLSRGLGATAVNSLALKLQNIDCYGRGINLCRKGLNPILIADEDVAVLPDFVIGQRLCDFRARNASLILLELVPHLERHSGENLGQLVRLVSVPRFIDTATGVEYEYLLGGDLGFQVRLKDQARPVQPEIGRDEQSPGKSIDLRDFDVPNIPE